MALPRPLPYDLHQTQWAQTLDPIVSKPLVQGSLLKNVALINGTTVVNHLLGRQMQGWCIADINGAATIYRSAPFSSTTLTLTSNAAVTVALWVF
jgi:hypothetical protein